MFAPHALASKLRRWLPITPSLVSERFQLPLAFESYTHLKDPCPVYDGATWHLYGTGCLDEDSWEIYHFTAPGIGGPWSRHAPIHVNVQGRGLAAPGVIFDAEHKVFHLYIQTEWNHPGGTLEHLVSQDGEEFMVRDTCLTSLPETQEAGIYDPHPSLILDRSGVPQCYVTYTGFPEVEMDRNRADIYLARSVSGNWHGPWARLGSIMRQEFLAHHNQSDHVDYEWGLEGSQLLQLPNGLVLLNAVCYPADLPRGARQRVFLAVARQPRGPFVTLGTILTPQAAWESGENGHAAGMIMGESVYLFYQARPRDGHWTVGVAVLKTSTLCAVAERALPHSL